MSCSVLPVFFFPLNSFHTRELSWLCQSFSVYIQTTCISHNPALLSLHAACLLVKAEWITGWSHRGVMWLVEMILHRERTVVQDDNIVIFFFFCLNMMHCSSTIHSSTPFRWGESGVWGAGWSGEPVFVFTVRKREWDRERKSPSIRPSIRVLSTHSSTPPTPGLLQCWSVSKRREEGRVQLIRDQWRSVSVLISDQEQWVGPAPPLPYTSHQSPPHHISTHIRAAGPADRGAPPWPSTVRGWCSSGTDAGHLHVQKEGVSLGQSRRGPWSLEGGPVQGNGVLIPGNKMTERRRFYNYITIF